MGHLGSFQEGSRDSPSSHIFPLAGLPSPQPSHPATALWQIETMAETESIDPDRLSVTTSEDINEE